MITPQFKPEESDISIMERKFYTLVEQTISSDLKPKIFKAYSFAKSCHSSQTRDEGTPYILHPLRISIYLIETIQLSERFLKKQNVSKEDTVIVALFHDILEDYGENIAPLIEKEFGKEILRMIQLLTKGDPMVDYYNQLKKAPEIVRIIKVLDRLDNLRGLLKSKIKSDTKKKNYLLVSKSKILPLIDPDYSPECSKVVDIFRGVISYLEKSLCKPEQ